MQNIERPMASRIPLFRFVLAVVWLVLVLVVSVSSALAAVHGGRAVLGADGPVLSFMVGHRTAALTVLGKVISTVAGPVGLDITLLLVLALDVRRRRRFDQAIVGVITLAGVNLINTVIKAWVARPRPDIRDRVTGVSAEGLSFPSGHTIQSTAIYGVIAVVLWRTSRRIRPWLAGGLSALLILAVGAARLYLGVHWFSDVLAGWVFGVSWLAVVLAAESIFRQWRTGPVQPRDDGTARAD